MTLQQWGTGWRQLLVDELRKTDPEAFTGPNKLRFAFQGPTEHTAPLGASLTFENGVMVLSDTPRDKIVLAAFPMWMGPLRPVVTPTERNAVMSVARAAAAANDVTLLEVKNPDGQMAMVYIRQLAVEEDTFLVDGPPGGFLGGPSDFTNSGMTAIKDFADAAARAAVAFFADTDDPDTWLRYEAAISAAIADRSGKPAHPRPPAAARQQGRAGACFVATAVYHSYDAPQVRVLRHWRDTRLLTTWQGRALVRAYYRAGPHLAAAVSGRRRLSGLVRRRLDHFVARLLRRGTTECLTQVRERSRI